MNSYENTHNTWNMLAQRYHDLFKDIKIYDKSYRLFCETILKTNANILELGCGPGNLTRSLLELRPDFNILATDVAPNMIEFAQKNNPGANHQLMDVRKLDSLKESYDGIVCGFCLPYLALNDCSKLIEDSAHLINKDGVFYLSFIEGNKETSKIESSSDGKYQMEVFYYSENFISNLLTQNEFETIHLIKIPYSKANGSTEVHLIFIARWKGR